MRLVLYTMLLSSSCCCFLYIQGELLFNSGQWVKIGGEYAECLLTENLKIENGLDGDLDSCEEWLADLPTSMYYMQGTMIMLIATASFILSCSNTRKAQW
eukprot:549954_1